MFHVQGFQMATRVRKTWLGVSYSEAKAKEIAESCRFEPRYTHGAGDQAIARRRANTNAAKPSPTKPIADGSGTGIKSNVTLEKF
jgi:hypothetical protein